MRFVQPENLRQAGRSVVRRGAPVLRVLPTGMKRVRGTSLNGVNVFKGVPDGGSTSGGNRFMPPTAPAPWQGTREALAWGATAPQTVPGARRE